MTLATPPAPPQSKIPIDVKEISPESQSCPKPKSPEFHSDLRKNYQNVRVGQGKVKARFVRLAHGVGVVVLGGHGLSAYEQKTQQSPGFGRSTV